MYKLRDQASLNKRIINQENSKYGSDEFRFEGYKCWPCEHNKLSTLESEILHIKNNTKMKHQADRFSRLERWKAEDVQKYEPC